MRLRKTSRRSLCKIGGTVEGALDEYAMTGRGHVIALQGRSGFRMRIGAYLVIFDEYATTSLAIYIGRRSTTTYRRN